MSITGNYITYESNIGKKATLVKALKQGVHSNNIQRISSYLTKIMLVDYKCQQVNALHEKNRCLL